MATRFDLPHIDISARITSSEYAGQGSGGSSTPRIRAEHGARLANELSTALIAADVSRIADERLEPVAGSYIEVQLRRGSNPDILERKTSGITPRAVKDDDTGRTVALFVPDHARVALSAIIEDYRAGPLTEGGQPRQKATVEAIENFRRARLETLWTDDPAALPDDPQHQMWWSVWVAPGDEASLEDVCRRLNLRPANKDRRLYFPEATVVPVVATRAAIELMMFATGIIAELRRATDTPVFFIDDVRDTQHEWNDDLAARITWPGTDVPAVCLLDTGVNRGHALLEPALSTGDQHAIELPWGVDDHHDHGTNMAGMVLHGDLTAQLSDTSQRILTHRLESVKLLPPRGFAANDPHSYGVLTQAAVALPEIAQPDRTRIYCMAVTNENVSGAQASTWSAAIDQAASGTMIGDEDDAPRRLFVLSAGNSDAVMTMAQWPGQDAYPAEDPSQAWNALTVGGYTDLVTVTDVGYQDWTPMASIGTLSPHTRTSVGWRGRAPFKPELVLEAGNRAVSPSRNDLTTLDSLSLLTTGRDVGGRPLVSFNATSAAAAQAARMAAQLAAAHPDYWPEMIRALMVHSGEYTGAMRAALDAAAGLRDRYPVIRQFGYGVPDYDRANASARDHVALIAQSPIQPFRLQGGRKFNECHYYQLPLPNDTLEQLGNEEVSLKVTLSYFIQPNPGFSANVDPQRYQSFGLRFDLRRKGESLDNFKKRVNVSERDNPRAAATNQPDDARWLLGPDSMSAGSIHCDTWQGPAIDLLGRDRLCIKPVGGWWRDRASRDIVDQTTRYALVVTLKAPRVDVDLHTAVMNVIVPPIAGEIEI
ncbi:S8 family peptidase [Aestuariivirga sp.]|uniref:S8 family peptidase n=1 Tax=Aestuariivirga sp. TaxID=2650926 RepID=UPI003BAADE94